MNVSLTPKLERMVKAKVKSGLYNSASEVIRESLRALDERDRDRKAQVQELRAKVKESIAAIEAGEYIDVDQAGLRAMFDDIKAQGRRRLADLKRKRA